MNVVYGSGRLCCKCIDFCIIHIDLAANSKQLRKWQWRTPWVWLPDWLLRGSCVFSGLMCTAADWRTEFWNIRISVIGQIFARSFPPFSSERFITTLFKACRPKLDRCKVIMTVLVFVCVDGIWLLFYDVLEQRGEYMGIGLEWLNWASRLLYYINWIILSWGWHRNDK